MHLVQAYRAEAAILLRGLLRRRRHRPLRGGAPRGARAPPPPGRGPLLPTPAWRPPGPRRLPPPPRSPRPTQRCSPSRSRSRPDSGGGRRNGVGCDLATRRRIRFLLGLPSPPMIGWRGRASPVLPSQLQPGCAQSAHKGRQRPANSGTALSAREAGLKLAPPQFPAGCFWPPASGVGASCPIQLDKRPRKFARSYFFFHLTCIAPITKLLLILFLIG